MKFSSRFSKNTNKNKKNKQKATEEKVSRNRAPPTGTSRLNDPHSQSRAHIYVQSSRKSPFWSLFSFAMNHTTKGDLRAHEIAYQFGYKKKETVYERKCKRIFIPDEVFYYYKNKREKAYLRAQGRPTPPRRPSTPPSVSRSLPKRRRGRRLSR